MLLLICIEGDNDNRRYSSLAGMHCLSGLSVMSIVTRFKHSCIMALFGFLFTPEIQSARFISSEL